MMSLDCKICGDSRLVVAAFQGKNGKYYWRISCTNHHVVEPSFGWMITIETRGAADA